jgi:Xaa-Pro aminopeptidase
MIELDNVMEATGTKGYVAVGSSSNPDVRYLTHFRTEDPVVYIKLAGEKGRIIVGQMERARAEKESITTVMTRAESGLLDILKEQTDPGIALALTISRLVGGDVLVPPSFPYRLGHDLESLGRVAIDPDTVRTIRAVKTRGEINQIRAVQGAAESAMKVAIKFIQNAIPHGEILFHKNEPLTSEMVRAEMHKTLMDAGCHAVDTIVSCGKETAIPHVLGTGPLHAHEPIVLDIFPQADMTGYYSDMTRTVAKGEPDEKLVEMYHAVREAQDLGQSLVRSGTTGQDVHQAVVDFFHENGFESGKAGFIHSLGHGVGLEVHEQPSVGPGGGALTAGNVVTVEPGLYYEEIGGVRLENIGAVTNNGFDLITRFPREFVL